MMMVFLKSMGNKAWKYVMNGWKHPVVTFEYGTTSLKSKAEWIGAEDEEALRNSKTLNLQWYRQEHVQVDQHMFRSYKS